MGNVDDNLQPTPYECPNKTRLLMEAYASACTAVRLCKTLMENATAADFSLSKQMYELAVKLREERKVLANVYQ